MNTEDRNRSSNRIGGPFKRMFDIIRGLLYVGVGFFVIFAEKLGFSFTISRTWMMIFGGILILYGGFRIYRGAKQ